jgi:hypothetical protein
MSTVIGKAEVGFSDHAIGRCFDNEVEPDEVLDVLGVPHFAQPSRIGMGNETQHYVRVNSRTLKVITGIDFGPSDQLTIITVTKVAA